MLTLEVVLSFAATFFVVRAIQQDHYFRCRCPVCRGKVPEGAMVCLHCRHEFSFPPRPSG